MLHRAGEIELPAVRQISLNPLARREPPAPMLIDTTPITGTLSQIQPIEFEPGAENRRRAVVQQSDGTSSLPGLRTARGRAPEVSGLGSEKASPDP